MVLPPESKGTSLEETAAKVPGMDVSDSIEGRGLFENTPHSAYIFYSRSYSLFPISFPSPLPPPAPLLILILFSYGSGEVDANNETVFAS